MGEADVSETKLELTDEARFSTGSAWFDYLQLLDPFRSDLFRYCRRLTGNLWDAEDLVQDTLEKGFAKLGSVHHAISKPRAYMLRIASNLWIDGLRRRGSEAAALDAQHSDPTRVANAGSEASVSLELRDAGAALMQQLAPQERAAVVLKDVFDLSLAETAAVLGTSIGAIRAALHRGRARLKDAMTPRPQRSRPSKETVDRFVDHYNARDLPALLALLLDDASIEMYGHVLEIGREGFEREKGWFHHNFYNPVDGEPSTATWEGAEFRGERIILIWSEHEGERVLGSVMRIEERDGRVSRIRVYALCPDVVDEVAGELGLPTGPLRMYRFPFRMSAPTKSGA